MTSKTDLKAGADVSISEKHMQIHRGISFHTWAYVLNAGSGEFVGIGLRTPTNMEMHMDVEYSSRGSVELEVIEDCDWNPARDLQVFNKNRIVDITSDIRAGPGNISITGSTSLTTGIVITGENGTITSDPITNGTLIFKELGFFDPIPPRLFGGGINDRELVLAKNETYVFRLISDVENNSLSLALHWYELHDEPYRKEGR